MSPEKSNSDSYAGNIIWGIIVVFGILQIWTYFKMISRKEEQINYEAIIAEKDLIIEGQQRQLERQNKIIEDLQ